MKFGKIILYVSDVQASLRFFEEAFGLKTRFVTEQGYGEIQSGETTLAFASYQVAQYRLPEGYSAAQAPPKQMNFEIALVSESVENDFARAVRAGAEAIEEPNAKPWGQTVSHLRCPDGTFVDLSSPPRVQS
ncbi:MAG: VOC family protein [Candidatus Eremiobacteraeota bacterium]|nr:VOC family protein [Candidatus Eremiobacteraeota bacterium]